MAGPAPKVTKPGRAADVLLLLAQARACIDFPAWADRGGNGCTTYQLGGFCAADGSEGPNWNTATMGTMADYAVDGVTAAEACCACGGGLDCQDDPAWVDSSGSGCAVHEASSWCMADGSPGPGWSLSWGSFAHFAVDGVAATDACCSCGGGFVGDAECQDTEASDWGGDGCAYYELHPEHCGCCDTPSFTAVRDCCLCRSSDASGATVSAVVASWPRKATRLPAHLVEYTSEELTELVIRCPGLEELNLESTGLRGVIPPDLGRLGRLRTLNLGFNDLHGDIPPELGNLTSLETLHLHGNSLSGSIPPQLGGLGRLRALNLAFNDLHGDIPPELGNLTSLETLYLHGNSLSGSIPPQLGGLGRLRELALGQNKLSGSLPPQLGNLISLELLYLSFNDLHGDIPPELGKLGRVRELALASNQLSGSLPPELGNLSSLRHMILSYNSLSGSIPPELGGLSLLRELHLASNQLSGSVPPELGSLTSLEEMRLYNNSLSGSIPSELGGLGRLVGLLLYFNRLSGSLPPELGKLRSLEVMKLYTNSLSGSIPPELGGLDRLSWHDFAFNEFSGSLPPELGKLGRLRHISFLHNSLSGIIPPELGGLSLLRELHLADNRLSGSLPPELGNLASLKVLSLKINQLSGSLPPELGKLSRLAVMALAENAFGGSIPSEFGGLSLLRLLDLADNQLSGSVPPELGNLPSVKEISLQSNRLSGSLPRELGKLDTLRGLYIHGNELISGSLSVLQELESLLIVRADDCSFSVAGALPPKLEQLHLSGNKLTAIPSEWRAQTLESLLVLRLDRNRINTWEPAGVFPEHAFLGGAVVCRIGIIQSHAWWPKLRHLNISGNPLNVRARDFLHSLAYLPMLHTLDAALCELHGDVPWEYSDSLAPAVYEEESCSGDTANDRNGFMALFRLDLSNNNITVLDAPPSTDLTLVDLSNNSLSSLHVGWYNEEGSWAVASLNVEGNPDLQRPVGIIEGDLCPSAGADRLLASSAGFVAMPGSLFECTALCPGVHTRVRSNPTINSTILCRCRNGQGVGTECAGCPNDTFSELQFVDGHYERVCRHCPLSSEFREDGVAESYRDCQCGVGLYMVDVLAGEDRNSSFGDRNSSFGECSRCPQWPFRTTEKKGAASEDACACSAEYADLLGSGGRCGCQDGYFMDHVHRACSPCSIHEYCTWGVEGVTQSLEPPEVRPGFWAEPPPSADEFRRRNFSGHVIWQCASKYTCLGGSRCGLNRMGQACGLCEPSHYGAFNRPCVRCKFPPRAARDLLAAGLVMSVPVPFLAHLWLELDANPQGISLKLRAFQTSLGQFLQFIQVLGIISSFRVEWPAMATEFLIFGSASTEAPSWLGVACLGEAQSMELELGFRWITPCFLALLIGASSALILPCHSRLQAMASRIRMMQGASMRMGPWEGLRVLALILNLFYATLLQWGLLVFGCVPSPSGQFSLAMFPHVRCSADEAAWVTWAVIGALYTAFILALFPLCLYLAWRNAATCIVKSRGESKGWWRFWFRPYRPMAMSWILSILARSIALNVAAIVSVGRGTAQLVLAGFICAGFACKAAYTMPYYDLSNVILDVWYGFAAAAIVFVTAAAGFQTDPSRNDISEIITGSEYEKLATAMVVIFWFSFVVPVVVMTYQVLLAFNSTQWLIPNRFRPLMPEEHVRLVRDFSSLVGIDVEFQSVLLGLDNIETWAFWHLMTNQKPLLGMTDLQSQMSPLRRSGIEFSQATSSFDREDRRRDPPAAVEATSSFGREDRRRDPPAAVEAEEAANAAQDAVKRFENKLAAARLSRPELERLDWALDCALEEILTQRRCPPSPASGAADGASADGSGGEAAGSEEASAPAAAAAATPPPPVRRRGVVKDSL